MLPGYRLPDPLCHILQAFAPARGHQLDEPLRGKCVAPRGRAVDKAVRVEEQPVPFCKLQVGHRRIGGRVLRASPSGFTSVTVPSAFWWMGPGWPARDERRPSRGPFDDAVDEGEVGVGVISEEVINLTVKEYIAEEGESHE